MANRYSDDWFSDGCYFSDDGETIHAADGTALFYLDRSTNVFHRYADGCPVFYYDLFGEHLYRFKGV